MNFLKNYGGMIFLGFALGQFAKLHFSDWQFYAIIIPTAILVTWSKSKD